MAANLKEAHSAPALKQLWHVRCAEPSPLALAAQLGWLHQEMRDDHIVFGTMQESETTGIDALPSIRQGDSAAPIWSHSIGGRTRVIGLNWAPEYQAILALPASGIRKAGDLRGRRLGLPQEHVAFDGKRAAALRGFVVALQLAAIDPRTAEFVDVSTRSEFSRRTARNLNRPNERGAHGGVVQALFEKRVDAIYVQGLPGIEIADALKATVVIDLRSHPDPLARANSGGPRPITVDAHIAETRPDLVTRLLSRIVAVDSWVAAHPAASVACAASLAGVREELIRRAYGTDFPQRYRTDLDAQSVMALHTYKNFLCEWGLVTDNFDIESWIDTRPLEAVRALQRQRTIRFV